MKKEYLLVLIIILNLIIVLPAFADETETFSAQKPDVLLILDGSGSMVYEPTGQDCKNTASTSYSCTNKVYGNSNCDNTTFGTYSASDSSRNTDCRKISIAQRAIVKILDDQKAKQKVRMGFMGFNSCVVSSSPEGRGDAINPKSGGAYVWSSGSGCNYLRNAIDDSYTSDTVNIFESIKTNVNAFSVGGGTPLVASLAEAKKFFQDYSDSAKKCRPKFVIVLSDGDDTYACAYATGNENQANQYLRRRESVAATKALYDAFYEASSEELRDQKVKTFVIGFGFGMPNWSEYTLNWMAYYGHTSFSTSHTGDVNAYKLDTTNPTDLYPYNSSNIKVTACDTTKSTATICGSGTGCCDGYHTGCVNLDQKTDPGRNELTGYAFMAANATQLDNALQSAFKVIESTYSFATSSVQSVRTKDENYIYEASFSVRNNDPFFVGHLKQYKINKDGTIPTDYLWDAGAVLKTNTSRNIWTYKNGSALLFNSSNVTYTDLGVADATEAGKIVTFINGGDVTNADDDFNGWKLGDTFHSYPVTVGSPATYFCDKVDPTGSCSNNIDCTLCDTCTPQGTRPTCQKAFDIFRGYHQRTTALGNRTIVTGANDGQVHMFNTSNGSETWSFIPPNLLSQLKNISHQSHPETTLSHTYFIDGPISISDAWWPATGASTIGVKKCPRLPFDTDPGCMNTFDWHTWMVLSEGRGAKKTLWSQSSSCDSNLSPYYSTSDGTTTTTYPYYCGYYAFDLTDISTSNPTPDGPNWILGGALGSTSSAISSTDAPYLGEPWSKMIISRVRNNGDEQWVGFFGGGYSSCVSTDNPSCTTRGKGFFIADLKTGIILKRFSSATNPPASTALSMDYQLVAHPSAVDTDNDGFVDHVYMGDLGNNIWRFKLCLAKDDTESTKCNTTTSGRWISTPLLSSYYHYRKIYTQASVTRDYAGNMWVYVGTGDKMNPTATDLTYKDRFYAIIDNDLTETHTLANLQDITSSSSIYNPKNPTCTTSPCSGWYIDLSIGDGEKMLNEPVVFQGVIYFTTYVPPSGSEVCDKSGSSYLYAIDYVTGAGKLSGNTKRYEFIGYGIPSAPIVSTNPYGGTDIYVSTSQKNTKSPDTFVKKQTTPTMTNFNKTNLMMWRDKRIQ